MSEPTLKQILFAADGIKDHPEGCGGHSGCKNPPSGEMHPCPYQEDVNNDPEDCCFCCEDCQQECADDI